VLSQGVEMSYAKEQVIERVDADKEQDETNIYILHFLKRSAVFLDVIAKSKQEPY